MRARGWLWGVVCSLVALSGCGRAGRCNSATCFGCCDEAGVCQRGDLDAACGRGGGSCQECGAGGNVCIRQACSSGGEAGIDPALLGRDDTGGCAKIAFQPAIQQAGYMETVYGPPWDHVVIGVQLDRDPGTSPEGRRNELWLEVWKDPALPATRSFAADLGYADCEVCVGLSAACDGSSGCARFYYAVEGEVTVSRADKDQAAGRLTASGNTIHLVEWSFGADSAAPTGRCIELQGLEMDIPWTAD